NVEERRNVIRAEDARKGVDSLLENGDGVGGVVRRDRPECGREVPWTCRLEGGHGHRLLAASREYPDDFGSLQRRLVLRQALTENRRRVCLKNGRPNARVSPFRMRQPLQLEGAF